MSGARGEVRVEDGAYAAGEGCLVRVVRVPVRIVVLVVVVPVRVVWDALVGCGKGLERVVLRPVGRGIGWLWRTLVAAPARAIGTGLGWLGRTLVVAPLSWVYRSLLTPLGRGIAWCLRGLGAGAAWLGRALFVWPWAALWRYVIAPAGRMTGAGLAWLWRHLVVVPAGWLYRSVLTPVGRGIAWVARGTGAGIAWVVAGVAGGAGLLLRGVGAVLLWIVRWTVVVPAVALWRYVLQPVGRAVVAAVTVVAREVGDALGHCWRAAGFVSRAVGRFLGAVLYTLLVRPARWVHRTVLTPLGHAVRDGLWRVARRITRDAAAAVTGAVRGTGRAIRQALTAVRDSARRTRADIRRALFGAPERAGAAGTAGAAERGEPLREPAGPRTRTLGSSTTALTKD
ncbi:hypothetical protein [Streptomyces sp. MST-110588]|uniref:hypothetical protein n=1 Tax=Streptomyces sp. MST-110588 TaxID=2833628 RepID=UPI001F5CF4D0|nr:hypothetical protein [Streptomyces sp. MST-110588]UNO42022.1 hypothetical protein KGS77_23970 [Streptomyces sp. MST-110588]